MLAGIAEENLFALEQWQVSAYSKHTVKAGLDFGLPRL
jgi:hypothetical protein